MIAVVGCQKENTLLVTETIVPSATGALDPSGFSDSSHFLQEIEGTPVRFEGKFNVADYALYIQCLGGSTSVILQAGWGDDGST
jgi:hypothetical protein